MFTLLCLVSFGLWVYSIIWIYNEEEGAGAVLWAVLTFFFNGIALLIYGILYRSKAALVLAAAFVALMVVGGLAH